MIMLDRYLESETRSKTCWSMVLPAPVRSGIGTSTLPGNLEEAYRAGITPKILRRTGDDSINRPSALDRWNPAFTVLLPAPRAGNLDMLPVFSRMLDLGKKGWASV